MPPGRTPGLGVPSLGILLVHGTLNLIGYSAMAACIGLAQTRGLLRPTRRERTSPPDVTGPRPSWWRWPATAFGWSGVLQELPNVLNRTTLTEMLEVDVRPISADRLAECIAVTASRSVNIWYVATRRGKRNDLFEICGHVTWSGPPARRGEAGYDWRVAPRPRKAVRCTLRNEGADCRRDESGDNVVPVRRLGRGPIAEA